MSWTRTLTHTLDTEATYGRVLIGSLTDTALLNNPPVHTVGDAHPLRLQFARRATTPTDPAVGVPLPDGSTIVYSAKASGATGDLLFIASDFTPVLDELDAPIPGLYQAPLNLNTLALATLLAAPPTGQPKIILGEVEVRNADNTERISLQFDLLARPQVYIGDEGVPADGPPPYPLPGAIGLRGLTTPDLRLDITTLTGGTPEALDSLPTLGHATPYLIIAPISGALRAYLLTPGTDPEAAPGTIRPDDYATTTNEKIWKQIL